MNIWSLTNSTAALGVVAVPVAVGDRARDLVAVAVQLHDRLDQDKPRVAAGARPLGERVVVDPDLVPVAGDQLQRALEQILVLPVGGRVQDEVGGAVAALGFPVGESNGRLDHVVHVVAQADDPRVTSAGVDLAHRDDGGRLLEQAVQRD